MASLHPGRRFGTAATAALLIAALAAPPVAADDISESKGFRKAVTLSGIREHQQALQGFADANGGIRVSGTAGYDASAQYVYDKAAAAGYDVSFQEFTFTTYFELAPSTFEQTAPTPTTYVRGVDWTLLTQTDPGDVTASVTAVDLQLGLGNTSTSACEAADFAGFPAGNIALVQRGTCFFEDKAENAAAAGASGVVVMNQGNTEARKGLANVTLGATYTGGIPAVFTTYDRGVEFSTTAGLVLRMDVNVFRGDATTRNVIAETPGGDPERVVVIGAHLDSVDAGPGINDNGSGSGAILEIAEVFAAQGRVPRNKLRFMWYGAEEFGLVGSRFYVASLSQAEKDDIELMLNFDMVGSPNFVRFVYDGDNSLCTAPPPGQPADCTGSVGPPGSAFIESIFVEYFNSQGLASEPTLFSGRSDYGPFIAAGVDIPAGGLFTGAEGIKTAAQATIYGGTAGIQYDPCYHAACDTFAGSGSGSGATSPGRGLIGLDQMSDAMAHTVLFFSRTKVDVDQSEAAAAFRSAGASRSADAGPHPEADLPTR